MSFGFRNMKLLVAQPRFENGSRGCLVLSCVIYGTRDVASSRFLDPPSQANEGPIWSWSKHVEVCSNSFPHPRFLRVFTLNVHIYNSFRVITPPGNQYFEVSRLTPHTAP